VQSGALSVDGLAGGLDLETTLESGQSYHWGRDDGGAYERPAPAGAWYHTVADGEVIRARAADGRLEWEATTDAEPLLRRLLGLDDDLEAVRASAPDDAVVAAAFDAHRGLRVVRDPFFPCLVSFVCSTQMRVERIYRMQVALREAFGESVEAGGERYRAFPSPERLAAATEAELRDLGLGYRAPYVRETAAMVADGELTRADVEKLPYEEAREALTGYVGVGEKVADCVLLFSLGYLQAVPLDTWMRTAVEEHFPDCARGSYAETSRALRGRLGGDYAGYVQTYVFHHLRTTDRG
jgi:N-glycosylase/DNA lyase